MSNQVEKQAGEVSSTLGSIGSGATGVFGTASKVLIPAALIAPLLLGYGLGKMKKTIKDDSVPTAEAFQRELLKNKYDDTILSIAEKRKLLEGLPAVDEPKI